MYAVVCCYARMLLCMEANGPAGSSSLLGHCFDSLTVTTSCLVTRDGQVGLSMVAREYASTIIVTAN